VTKVISDPAIAAKYHTIYLGASEKGGDDKRFNYILKHAHPDIEIVNEPAPVTPLSPEYKAALKETGYLEKMPSTAKGKDPQNYHASDLRFLLLNACGDDAARKLAEHYVGEGNVDLYLETCEVVGGNQVEITESQLLEIIKEEAELVLQEASQVASQLRPSSVMTPMEAIRQVLINLEDVADTGELVADLPASDPADLEAQTYALQILSELMEHIEGAIAWGLENLSQKQ
jgi:hypothetical protein